MHQQQHKSNYLHQHYTTHAHHQHAEQWSSHHTIWIQFWPDTPANIQPHQVPAKFKNFESSTSLLNSSDHVLARMSVCTHLDIPDTKVSSTVHQHTVAMIFRLVNHLNTHTTITYHDSIKCELVLTLNCNKLCNDYIRCQLMKLKSSASRAMNTISRVIKQHVALNTTNYSCSYFIYLIRKWYRSTNGQKKSN